MFKKLKNLFSKEEPEKRLEESQVISEEDKKETKKEKKDDLKINVPSDRKYVIIIDNGDEGIEYLSNDDEYDVDFRNRCKEVIREDLFNRMGMEGYSARLEEFEPDVATAFKDIDYLEARSNYYESLYEYTVRINEVNPTAMSSNQLSMLWERVCEAEKRFKFLEKQRELEN